VKGSSAFIVAPSSSKPAGEYQRLGDVTDPMPAPKWVMDRLDTTGHIPRPVERRPAAKWTRARTADSARRYVDSAVQSELDIIASCHAGRNEQLSRSSFAIGQFVGAGLINEHEAHEAITQAAEAAGISPSEGKAQDTIRRGLAAGSHQPRTISTGASA
jgi:putative DNA primase/helicase